MRTISAVTIAILTLAAGPALADDEVCYAYEEVNVPGGDGGELYTSWFGINNREMIVGNFCIESDCSLSDDDNIVGGAIYNRKKDAFTTFTPPAPYNWVGAVSINERGLIVGEALVTSTSGSTAGTFTSGAGFVRYRSGRIVILSPPKSGVTFWGIGDVNNRGDMVGFFIDGTRVRGFIRRSGKYTIYDAESSGDTYLTGINDSGVITGNYRDGTGDRDGFIDDGDGPEYFDAPGAVRTTTGGIDNDEVVVGTSAPALTGNERSGFVDDDGDFTTLEFPGAFRTTMIGINDKGTVVGTTDFFSYGVIADPEECDDDDDDSSDDDDDSSDD